MKIYTIKHYTNIPDWGVVPILEDFSNLNNPHEPSNTAFQSYYTNKYFHFRFVVTCKKPLVYKKECNKMEVINSERIELFFRINEQMAPYYCLEIDASGRLLDYKAEHYRQFDYNWRWPEPLTIKATTNNNNYTVEAKLSIACLKELKLLSNNELQIGIFRGLCSELIGNKAKMEWISWVKPLSEKPDFHIPSAFGVLLFSPKVAEIERS